MAGVLRMGVRRRPQDIRERQSGASRRDESQRHRRARRPLRAFADRPPTVRRLALAFLALIGARLVADGFGHHIPRGCTYFAMFFAVAVEMLNLRQRRREGAAVRLHETPRLAKPDAGGVT